MNKHIRKYIESSGPTYINPHMIVGDPNAFRCQPITDGDHTIVQLTLHGEVIAYGVAKRHPGDKHNRDLGMALALTRAFTDAATRYAQVVERIMSPEVDPSAEHVRNLRNATRRTREVQKNARRKAAREAWREAWGWDHTDRPAGLDRAREESSE